MKGGVVFGGGITVTLCKFTIVRNFKCLGLGMSLYGGIEFIQMARSEFMFCDCQLQHRLDMRERAVEGHT